MRGERRDKEKKCRMKGEKIDEKEEKRKRRKGVKGCDDEE